MNGKLPNGFYIRPYKTLRTRIQLRVIGKIKSVLEQDPSFKNRKFCIPRFANEPILKVDNLDEAGRPMIDEDGKRKTTSFNFKKCLENFASKLKPEDRDNLTKFCLMKLRADKLTAQSTLLQAFYE